MIDWQPEFIASGGSLFIISLVFFLIAIFREDETAASQNVDDAEDERKHAMARIEACTDLDWLFRHLDHPIYSEAVVDRLASLKHPDVLDRFHKILVDEDAPRDRCRAVIRGLGQIADPRSVGPITTAWSRFNDGTLDDLAIEAFKRLRSTAAEPFLLEIIHEKREHRLEAIRTLACCGTKASLATLSQISGQRIDTPMKLSIEHARSSIENRFGDVDQGWLSLSQRENAGELSLPDGDEGQLSLSPKDET